MIKQVERVPDDSIFVMESCHSTWIFDTDKLRFRRILKGLSLDAHAATTAWRAYFGLEIDPISESFVVLLNPEGNPPPPFVAPRRAVPPVRWRPDGGVVAGRAAGSRTGLRSRRPPSPSLFR